MLTLFLIKLTPAPSLLLQLNYITPSGGGVLALVVVLDGVGKDFGFLAFALGVLLSAKDNSLGAVNLVDFIHGFVHMEQGTGTCSTF